MNNEFAQDDNYISKKEMAVRMKVTPRTIDAWMAKGLVPYRKIGRTVRFHWGEVGVHLKSRSRPAVVPVVRKPGDGIAGLLRQRAAEIRRVEVRRKSQES